MWVGIKAEVFLMVVAIIAMDNVAYAATDFVYSDIYGTAWTIDNNTFIAESASVVIDNINVAASVFVSNAGTISGNINVCETCHLYIQNSGTINGEFYLENGAEITQVIRTNRDLTNLGLDSNYDILVNGTENISISGLINISGGVDRIVLDDAHLTLDNLNLRSSDFSTPVIELVGDVIIYLESISALNGRPILSNVHGDGRISVYTNNNNPLYAVSLCSENNNIYANMIRETDYAKILKNKIGVYINSLRLTIPDDKLLIALDTATDMDGVNNLISRSVRLNPINLMAPIHIFNSFERLDMGSITNKNVVGIAPIYIFSVDSYIYGAKGHISFTPYDGISLSASAYLGIAEYEDDINHFAADFYGANMGLDIENDDLIFRSMFGITIAKFDTGPVFDGNGSVYNPSGISVYAFGEIGRKLEILHGISVVGFIGASSDFDAVVHSGNTDTNAYVGADFTYKTKTADISYDYGLRVRARVGGEIEMVLRAHFWSPADQAGGDVQIGAIQNEFGKSYQIKFGAKINF